MYVKNTFTCPICGDTLKVTSPEGVTCCLNCGYVYSLLRREASKPVFIEEEYRGKYLIKIRRSEDNQREQRIKRAIEELSESLRLRSDVKERAQIISVKALRSKRGKVDPYSLAASSIILASRESLKPMSVNEVLKVLREMGRDRKIKHLMRMIKLIRDSGTKVSLPPIEKYIEHVILSIFKQLNEATDQELIKLKEKCIEILKRIPKRWILGKSPLIVASTIVYAAEVELAHSEGRRKRFSQRLIAECVNQSEYAIRERVLDLYDLNVLSRCKTHSD